MNNSDSDVERKKILFPSKDPKCESVSKEDFFITYLEKKERFSPPLRDVKKQS